MTETELRSQEEIKTAAKLCETALLEAGIDYDGIENIQNWLIHDFVDNAPYHYIDEISCEIT